MPLVEGVGVPLGGALAPAFLAWALVAWRSATVMDRGIGRRFR